MTGPGASSGPGATPTPTPTPTASGPYGALTLATHCQTTQDGTFTVSAASTGQVPPDLHVEFATTADFAEVYAYDAFVMDPGSLTFAFAYDPDAAPNGLWVRWKAAPTITAHDVNKGWCAGSSPAPSATPGPPPGLPTIVSIGDSYISGEAGRWAGNSLDSSSYVDALGATAYNDNATGTAEILSMCHRSRSAEVHIDQWRTQPQLITTNLACSGATTQSRWDGGNQKPGIDNCPGDIHRTDCPTGIIKGQGTLLTTEAMAHNVKLVVLSIGGNDFEFSSIVEDCVIDWLHSPVWLKDYCKDDDPETNRFTDTFKLGVRTRLVEAYTDVALAMEAAHYPDDYWSLLVQTYPSPLPTGDNFRYDQFGWDRFTYGCAFWSADADWANSSALADIGTTIRAAVAQFKVLYPAVNVQVMDLSQAFVGRRVCEKGVDTVESDNDVQLWTQTAAVDKSEWIDQIRGIDSQGGKLNMSNSPYFKVESFHPNYWGQLALRNCLRQAWNNGTLRGGTCKIMQTGLNAFSEPSMVLSQP
jgi:hypothetical protein